MANVVKNESKGYNYSYASLGDIANQGFAIPKMKTGTENSKEYVYYFDDEIKEWIRGAEIIVPDGKGMNKAQLYGSALTYARRYTVLMADKLATDDDVRLEKTEGVFDEPTPVDIEKLAKEFNELIPKQSQAQILNYFNVQKPQDLEVGVLQGYVDKAMKNATKV